MAGPSGFAWEDFLAFAAKISKDRPAEAEARTAVSRAYYAAYNVTLTIVRTRYFHEFRTAKGDKHKQLWDFLQSNESVRTEVERLIGSKGDDLRDLRNKADYEFQPADIRNWSATLIQACTLASYIVEKAKSK